MIDVSALRYYRTTPLWPRLRPIFESDWITEMWREKMMDRQWQRYQEHGIQRSWDQIVEQVNNARVPADLDGCDWRCERIGRPPRWHDYVCHGACHWMAPVYLAVISELEPGWELISGTLHTTTYNRERGLTFDLQFEALCVSAPEAYLMAAFETLKEQQAVAA